MSIEGIVPLIAPFVLGLFSGILIKRGIKLIFAAIGLIVAMIATGYLSIGFETIRKKAMEYLPKLMDKVQSSELQILPYSSGAFLLGLALGFWRG